MKGYVFLWRSLFDREDWLAPSKRDPACAGYAWMYLIQKAQYGGYDHAGVRLKQGEVVISTRLLADAMAWSQSRAARFVLRLRGDSMIESVRDSPHGTVYLIVNYPTYQNPGKPSDSPSDSPSGSRATHERLNNKKEERKNTTSSGKPGKSKKVLLPDDWTPTDSHRARALASRVNCEREAEKFRLHADTNARRAVNWNSAFTTWLMNAEEWARPEQPEKPRGMSNGSLRSQMGTR